MPAVRRTIRSVSSDAPDPESSDDFQDEPVAKRRKKVASKSRSLGKPPSVSHKLLFTPLAADQISEEQHLAPCSLPSRKHSILYHRPLLLSGDSPGRHGRESLLKWFDSVSHTRKMPWRKEWIDPSKITNKDELREALEKRAYQVWISEIMLQQTRVATVIDYWNRWMAKWPTIHDLAQASEDDVRGVWQGLGYYSRGTRILEAAKQVTADSKMKGLLPDEVDVLVDKIPGVGRYTAGAICAIVFGKAAPMVDGNVLRVLSRQLGIFGDVQKSKPVVDTLWGAADALVKAATGDGKSDIEEHEGVTAAGALELSDVPGRWGQALMELGSTVCTPVPNCGDCPISVTCRAYAEGSAAGEKSKTTAVSVDIEDMCSLCEPFEDTIGDDKDGDGDGADAKVKKSKSTDSKAEDAAPAKKKKQQATLAAFAFTQQTTRKAKANPATEVASAKEDKAAAIKRIVQHANKFPVRTVKKPVREEETVVCAVQRPDGRFLLAQRPEKGLLAGLWEMPSKLLDIPKGETPDKMGQKARSTQAKAYVTEILGEGTKWKYQGELGSVPWLFSHIKLTMHVHSFRLEEGGLSEDVGLGGEESRRMWNDVDGVEAVSMGTGMRKCWDMVKG